MKPKKARTGDQDKKVVAAVVGVVCLALVMTVFFITSSGSADRQGKGIKAQTTTPGTTAPGTSAPAATIDIEEVIVPPLSIYRHRNPFKPLIYLEAEVTTTSGVGVEGVVTVPPELNDGASSVLSTAVTLEGTWEQDGRLFARLRVGESVFDKVAVGDVFADHYKLISISLDSSATILYGDERFTVLVGQSIYW